MLIIFIQTIEEDGVIVLEYHTVTNTPDIDSEIYNVRPDDFATQLDYLQENGYNSITALEYMKWKRGKLELPKKNVILTFDDGYEDNYKEMLPILEAHNMKAVVYVITNLVGHEGYLTLEQLKEMTQRGVEIGSHTANHRPLDELTTEELKHELGASKQYLEWSGISPVLSLSYPNGAYNDEVMKVAKDTGYLTAVTGDSGVNDIDNEAMLLQRINILEPKFGLLQFKFNLLKGRIFTKLGINQHKIIR